MKDLDPPALVRDHDQHAEQINAMHLQCSRQYKSSIACAKKIGDMLKEVRDHLPEGKFADWIQLNCKFSRTMAYKYVKISDNWKEVSEAQSFAEAMRVHVAEEDDAPPSDDDLPGPIREKKPPKKQDEEPPKKPKKGEPKFDWRHVEEPFGVLVRAIDSLGTAYRAKTSQEADYLRGLLREFHEHFKDGTVN